MEPQALFADAASYRGILGAYRCGIGPKRKKCRDRSQTSPETDPWTRRRNGSYLADEGRERLRSSSKCSKERDRTVASNFRQTEAMRVGR